MSGRRRGIRQGWERDRDERKRKRETVMGERKIERETGAGERNIGRKTGVGERDRGEREKITNTKKLMEFCLVVLHSAERSEARQWIVLCSTTSVVLQSGYHRNTESFILHTKTLKILFQGIREKNSGKL